MLERADRLRTRTLISILALLAGVLTSAPAAWAAGCAGAHAAAVKGRSADLARAVVCEINRVRARHGLHRVRTNRDIQQAARGHTVEMVRRNYFSHVSPSGTTPADRLRRSGYLRRNTAWHVGETLAWGTGPRSTPAAIVRAWIHSTGHRHILLMPDFRSVGVGASAGLPVTGQRYPGGTYTADFGVRH
ncbi:MAG TPA: CAP domain-containing protein [Solirubrobacteraceae bacterium]|jgi:uncharacterized protein YkwD